MTVYQSARLCQVTNDHPKIFMVFNNIGFFLALVTQPWTVGCGLALCSQPSRTQADSNPMWDTAGLLAERKKMAAQRDGSLRFCSEVETDSTTVSSPHISLAKTNHMARLMLVGGKCNPPWGGTVTVLSNTVYHMLWWMFCTPCSPNLYDFTSG